MPQLNRDKETLYPPGRLHVWFLAASVLLVGSLVWMLADDFVRPWKSVQRAYWKRLAGVLESKREMLEARVRDDAAAAAALKAKNEEVAAAERALAAQAGQLADLRARADEQQALADDADRNIKAVKGKYSAVRYQFQLAELEGRRGDQDRLRGEVNRLGSEQDAWEARRRAAEVEKARLVAEIDARRAKVTKARAERDELVKAVEDARTQLDDARGRTERGAWRDAPLADIVAPQISIQKAVLPHIHDDYVFATSPKVDMCMTCHRGIDNPDMTEAAVADVLRHHLRSRLGESAWNALAAEPAADVPAAAVRAWLASGDAGPRPWDTERALRRWLSGTPSLLDLFREEEVEKAFGGKESDAMARFRARHLGGRNLAEGARDLLDRFAIRPVEWAHPHFDLVAGPKSKHPVTSFGCTTCHQGVGRRLDFVRAAHSPDSKAQRERWVAEHGWRKAELVDFPMLPARHVEGQCLKCHGPEVEFPAAPEPLQRWTKQKVKVGGEEKEVDVRLNAPSPVEGPESVVARAWRPETLQRGVEVLQQCMGCHLVRDFASDVGVPSETSATQAGDFSRPAPGSLTATGMRKYGPDLTHLRDKTTRRWAIRWLETPTAYRPDTRMPAFYKHVVHRDYVPVPGPDGRPLERTVVVEPTPGDLAQTDVELLAITTYLFDGQTTDGKPRSRTYPAPPPGDPARGKQVFYGAGCYACHLGPDDREGGDLHPVTRARFSRRDELPPGPRLTSLGSKLNAGWLYAWLEEPRHYNSVTRMPNMRWTDELGADGKTVVRTAAQRRADVVAYLLSATDPAFLARPAPHVEGVWDEASPDKTTRWTRESEAILKDMWKEWYGKVVDGRALTMDQADAEAERRLRGDLRGMLSQVGFGLVKARGCFGCHAIAGTEEEQPIGKELTGANAEGSQDIHKFDFGQLGHPHGRKTLARLPAEVAGPIERDAHGDMEATRWNWVETKIREPRVFDAAQFKPRWTDRLRMPKFNLTDEDRAAVAAVVLGLVTDKVQPGAREVRGAAAAKIARGRAVVERYGCNQCHTIEGRRGVAVGEQLDRGLELWMLPPNLYGEGNRTKADWLFRFLKHPTEVRPSVIQRMPMFRLTDEEAAILVDYFQALAGRADRIESDPGDVPLSDAPYPQPVSVRGKSPAGAEVTLTVRSELEEGKALFDTLNCVKCHLPKGTPGADPNEGASAPPFTLSGERLRRAWTLDLVHNPQWQIENTKMPAFWPLRGRRGEVPTHRPEFPDFQFGLRGKAGATPAEVAEAQMDAVVRYLHWHYRNVPAAAPPPAEPK